MRKHFLSMFNLEAIRLNSIIVAKEKRNLDCQLSGLWNLPRNAISSFIIRKASVVLVSLHESLMEF